MVIGRAVICSTEQVVHRYIEIFCNEKYRGRRYVKRQNYKRISETKVDTIYNVNRFGYGAKTHSYYEFGLLDIRRRYFGRVGKASKTCCSAVHCKIWAFFRRKNRTCKNVRAYGKKWQGISCIKENGHFSECPFFISYFLSHFA